MREIKFRYTCKRDNGFVFSQIFTLEEIEHGDVLVWAKVNIVDLGKVIREQFTGLRDKNGREIYEGDIILKRWWDKPYSSRAKGKDLKCIVGWDNENLKYDIIPVDKEHGMRGYDGGELFNVEIIGTIHENPELLL